MEPVCIIGHGKSPLGKKWGPLIDQCTVIRLKDPSWQGKEDYGNRCDYMASSTETLPVMLDDPRIPIKYYGQPKKGEWSKVTEANFRQRAKAPLDIPLELFLRWNAVFHEYSDIRNHSLGIFAITVACELLKATEVKLVGFDNLLSPELLEYYKANKGKWVTHHDWFAENKLLGRIREHYNIPIEAF